jgi:hypothetical protein
MPGMERRENDEAVRAVLRQGESASSRRVGLRLAVALALVAVAVGAGVAFWPRKPAHEPAEMDFSVYLPPIKTQPAAGGEETSPFTGFAVSIESDPPGAVVAIAGVVRGEAPVLANVPCRGSERIQVRAEKPGFKPARREVACRADTLVKLTLLLER